MPHITVDLREARSPVIQALRADPSLTLKMRELSAGDYLVREDVAIERKSAVDFVASIFDQRLFQQVARLKLEFARPIFVVEGDVFKTRSQITPQSLQGAISYLVAIEGVTLLTYDSPAQTAALIGTMARHLQDGLGYEVPTRAAKPKVGPDTAQFLLEGLPGCGPKTAKALVGTFGSALAAFNAPLEELCKVPGVGKKTAERIRDALTWQATTYP
ncbi:ERCC4 domain-containing protein [Paraburkholderia sp. A3RO-2L]|uniref:ERCC4 domain-containing protein n=1 Tax=unclassified Paraburkholderia TaxID=2615204 RepID=UPI003DA83F27